MPPQLNGSLSSERNVVAAETLRDALGLTENQFALRLGLDPSDYREMLAAGHLTQIVKNAVRGISARRRLDIDRWVLVRLTAGRPQALLVKDLQTRTIDGRPCLVFRLPPGMPVHERSGERPGDHTRVIEALLKLIQKGEVFTPAEAARRLAGELAAWYPEKSPGWRTRRLNRALWAESYERDGRIRWVRHGVYSASS